MFLIQHGHKLKIVARRDISAYLPASCMLHLRSDIKACNMHPTSIRFLQLHFLRGRKTYYSRTVRVYIFEFKIIVCMENITLLQMPQTDMGDMIIYNLICSKIRKKSCFQIVILLSQCTRRPNCINLILYGSRRANADVSFTQRSNVSVFSVSLYNL